MNCIYSVLICISVATTYVGSLYVWKNPFGRDHPSTIKKRSISVLLAAFIALIVVYTCADATYFKDYSFWAVIGIRSKGLLPAVVYPLFLTMVLFSGPFVLNILEGMYSLTNIRKYNNSEYNIRDLMWLRDYLVAPISEEFTFRSCMLPLLLPCFSYYSMFVCPLFFGIAHLHHLRERLAQKMQLKLAIMQSLLQLAFTTTFGIYSSFLFLRTGHFVSPFVAHAFCNFMGYPDFGLLLKYQQPKRAMLGGVFVCGLLTFALLLNRLTDPALYSNELYS